MVQMSFYCVYILPQSYARVQFPKFLRFLWEIKAASAKKGPKNGTTIFAATRPPAFFGT